MLTYAIYFDTPTQKGKRAVVTDHNLTDAIAQVRNRFGWGIKINMKEIINQRAQGPARIDMVT